MQSSGYQFDSHSWRGVLDTTLCDKVQGQWFSSGTPVTSTNKTDRHADDITVILLKVALNTTTLTLTLTLLWMIYYA
jgi:hypothetical protein